MSRRRSPRRRRWSSRAYVQRSLSSLQLDLDVDAGREGEPHERVDRFRGRRVDVDQPLVRPNLEVLPRVLVLERRADHAVHVLLRRQRHGTGDGGAGALSRVDDVLRGLVDLLMVIALQPYTDLLLWHRRLLSLSRYLMISVTTPAPTVRPPSRIAKRRP